MYLFIFAWVELDSWTQEAGHIMKCKERLLFFSTPFGQLDESLVETHHGRRTRESQAMGRRLRENMVTVLAYFLHSHSHSLNAVFPLTLPVIEKVVFFFLQGGSEGGWIWLPQSLRWGDSFPIQKEKVSMFIHAKRWDMVLLQHWKFPIMCCLVFLIPFSVAALPYRCSKSLACLLFKIS